MPTYRFECRSCNERFEQFLTMKESDDAQTCPSCQSMETGKLMQAANFNLVGDGWAGKNIRIKNQMQKRGEVAAVRQEEFRRESGKVPTLVPNVGGERVGSWGEAAKLAKDQGRNVESYNNKVRKEIVT